MQQGLKPILYFVAFEARLKSCPVTKQAKVEFFRSLKTPSHSMELIGIRRSGKSCPVTRLSDLENALAAAGSTCENNDASIVFH
jgi:hypothetical protein